MWTNFLSVIKNVDIASFLCEERCRHCEQPVPSNAEQKWREASALEERNWRELVSAHSISGEPAQVAHADNLMSSSETQTTSAGDSIHMSLVSETSESHLVRAQQSTGPPSTCLCPKCSELMWRSRQSLWSLPIAGLEQTVEECRDPGTTSGAVKLLTVATAGMYEGPMQKLIRRLKYDDDQLVVRDLGAILTRAYEMLLTAMPQFFDDKDDIFLVPVPLHPSRKRKRGYNQADLIAREFAKLNHMRVENGILKRKRKTRPQYGLGRKDRLSNIEGAFEFGGFDIRNKSVIIVDDVFTSGATLTTCAALLTECGAKQVAAMAAARAPYDKNVTRASTSHK